MNVEDFDDEKLARIKHLGIRLQEIQSEWAEKISSIPESDRDIPERVIPVLSDLIEEIANIKNEMNTLGVFKSTQH